MKLPSPLREILMCMLLPAMPLVVSLIIGRQFVPSPRWIEIAEVPATAFTIATTVGWFVVEAWRFVKGSQGGNSRSMMAVILVPAGVAVSSWMGSISLIPIASALLYGHPSELNYKVEMSNESGFLHCQTPIVLEKMPVGFDRVCGASDALREQIGPGSELILEGRGTEWGLFISSKRAAE